MEQLFPHLWNIKSPIVEHKSKSFDMSHDGQPLIRLILQLWNSCSTIGVQDLANHQLWKQ